MRIGRRGVWAWISGAAVVLLLLDFWRPGRHEASVWFGWLPGELAWRLVVVLVGWLWLLGFTTWIWRRRGEED